MIPRYSRPEMAALWTDEAKWERWLQVEIAVVRAWADAGAVPREDAEAIAANAAFVVADIDRYQQEVHHDTLAFLRSVNDHLGPEGRWVHHGLTTIDVWDTASALQIRDAAGLLEQGLTRLHDALVGLAREHKRTVCVGRTHGVHAEPTTFGLRVAGWVDEVRRHQRRLSEAKAQIAVGKISGTVGTHATVPPELEERVCKELGLGVEPVSYQVVQRDRHAQFVSTLAQIGASLEKFAQEFRHLQRTEVREVEEPFVPGQAGSSSMPHKRNPEKCERICGQARVLRGFATTALENVALWHERDISHTSAERIIVPDACLLLDYMLDLFAWIVENLQVYPQRMRENLDSSYGLVYSQRVLLALVEAGGMHRDEAYKLVQAHAMTAWDTAQPFYDLLAADTTITAALSAAQLRECFDPEFYLRNIEQSFERLGI
ncbi:MAG: adenylosuccinate lyase [Chloroflexi bacterium]|nr:adenylosuccinate lyase [Chloroflexota bacterium]